MNLKENWGRIKGWLPQEPYRMQSNQTTNPKSNTKAYIAGYGVGIGVGELYLLLVNELGWGAIRSSVSPALSLLLGILILSPGGLLGLEIGKILSKKLKERWAK